MSAEKIRLYDSHAHLVSDDVVRYPRNEIIVTLSMLSKGSVYGPGTIGLPGGMHGPNPHNEKPTAEKLHAWMREENVVGIAAVQKGMIYRTDNSYIVDAADLFPEEMRAIIIIDPREEKTIPMIRDYAKRGIVGIRFFPINVRDKVAWLSSPESMRVWELADELGLIVDIEAPATDGAVLIPLIESMADRFPNMSIVLDHIYVPDVRAPNFGIGSNFDGFAARNNISYKWTSINMDMVREKGFAPAEVLRAAVDFFGADKLMWGSDIGTSSGTYKEMVSRALESTRLLNAEERRKVLHDTGRRVMTNWTGS
jgi:L-fuconolactonase